MSVAPMLTMPLTQAALVLSQQPGGDNGGQGEDFGKSSPVGLLLLLLFLIAVALLVRSMTKHLKRIPASFDPPEDSDAGQSVRDGSGKASETADATGSTGKPEAESSDTTKSERSS
jgi:hypothetical protein